MVSFRLKAAPVDGSHLFSKAIVLRNALEVDIDVSAPDAAPVKERSKSAYQAFFLNSVLPHGSLSAIVAREQHAKTMP